MTTKYKNVYIKNTATIVGPYEFQGPLKNYFDESYTKDLYFETNSWEKAEAKLLKETINLLLKKEKIQDNNVELIISGDLQNQISASNYAIRDLDIPFLGVFSACASIAESIIIGANYIENKTIKNCLCTTVSHNMSAEKQFRNPTEYGAPKKNTSTFTVTGGAAALLTNQKTKIKITASTIGKIIDKGIKDVNNMGAIMAPAAADTIYRHLKDLKRTPEYYDLILTGDLGKYGKEILVNYLKKVNKLDISKNYNDCGTLIYDINKQPVFAGGSGPACSAITLFSYIYKKMQNKELKKILIVPTGAIFSQTMSYQKETIPAIAHAISLEVVE